jgi:hypothetical protein
VCHLGCSFFSDLRILIFWDSTAQLWSLYDHDWGGEITVILSMPVALRALSLSSQWWIHSVW